MVASPMMLIEFIFRHTVGLPGGEFGKVEGVFGIVYLVGFFCSSLGLRLLRVTGRGTIAVLLFGIQILGISLAARQNVLQLVGRADTNSKLFQVADAAWPLSHIFLIVIGIAVLRAKVWLDWRKFVPLLCGFALPVAMIAGAVAGPEALGLVFGVLTSAFFMLLSYAIVTADRSPSIRFRPDWG